MKTDISRRKLLITAAAAAPAALIPVKLIAAEKLDVNDPQAESAGLRRRRKLNQLMPSAWPKFKDDQNCVPTVRTLYW